MNRTFIATILWAAACMPVWAVAQTPTASCPALLHHTAARVQDGQPQALCQYSGKVLLVVNTASQCGYTPQYTGLEALHAQYAAKGLVIMGFPSNDFGQQEPGDAAKIGPDEYAVYAGFFSAQKPPPLELPRSFQNMVKSRRILCLSLSPLLRVWYSSIVADVDLFVD